MVNEDSFSVASSSSEALHLAVSCSNCCLFMPWPIWNAFVLATRIMWATLFWGKTGFWAGAGGSMLIMRWRHFCRVAACAGRCMIEK